VAYKGAIILQATMEARRAHWGLSEDAFEIELGFIVARPKSHFAKDGTLTSRAPAYPPKRSGDWDNLAKGVCDAITSAGVVWGDDDQVVEARVTKRYARPREMAQTVVRLTRLAHGHPS
jgi:Holliday junction resolvase RusA-like endonuclease